MHGQLMTRKNFDFVGMKRKEYEIDNAKKD
jgi:hypothetical protein